MQAAYFPAAQSDRSPLLEKAHWKAAVVTTPLFHTTETLAKGILSIAKCERSRREIESDVPGSGSPNRSEMTCSAVVLTLSMGTGYVPGTVQSPDLWPSVLRGVHGTLGDGMGSIAQCRRSTF